MNKKTMLLGASGALALCNGAYAGDYDLTFTPRVGVGMQKYELDMKSTRSMFLDQPETGISFKLDEYIPTLTIGGSVSMDRFYVDAYLQQTGTSDETGINNTKADRRDYAIALGYGFENGLSLSGGYKYGKTDISQRNDSEYGTSYTDSDFIAEGPFLGLGYSLNLGTGTLSLSGAVAFLDGKIGVTDEGASFDHLRYIESKPSTTGLALSLAWKAPITKQFTYGVSLDMHQYNFDEEPLYTTSDTIPLIGLPTTYLKVKEESVGIKASLSYSF